YTYIKLLLGHPFRDLVYSLDYKETFARIDVKTAFLYRTINKDIYIKLLEGFPEALGKVLKLRKSIRRKLYLTVYVDNINIFGTIYILPRNILNKYSLNNLKPVTTLAIVGSLNYLSTISRPNISYVVGTLARYIINPRSKYIGLFYLARTRLQSTIDIYGMYDSDWANYIDTKTVALLSYKAEYIVATKAIKEAIYCRRIPNSTTTKTKTPRVIRTYRAKEKPRGHRNSQVGGVLNKGNLRTEKVVARWLTELPTQRKWHNIQDFGGFDGRTRMAGIDTKACPVYMLTGEYDWSNTPEMAQKTCDKIPGGKHQAMKGLGHFPATENPKVFVGYVLEAIDHIQKTRA
ncbi:Hypothetical predicted protein, partial [Lecanosticta acicola]